MTFPQGCLGNNGMKLRKCSVTLKLCPDVRGHDPRSPRQPKYIASGKLTCYQGVPLKGVQ